MWRWSPRSAGTTPTSHRGGSARWHRRRPASSHRVGRWCWARSRAAVVELFAAEGARAGARMGRDFERHSTTASPWVAGCWTSRAPQARTTRVLLSLHGAHQANNAAVALTAAEAFFGRALGDDVVTEAFAEVRAAGAHRGGGPPARWWFSTGHTTPMRSRAVAEPLEDDFGVAGCRVVVLGMLAGRDPGAAVEALVRGTTGPGHLHHRAGGPDAGSRPGRWPTHVSPPGCPPRSSAIPAPPSGAPSIAAGEEDLVLVVWHRFRLPALRRVRRCGRTDLALAP